MNPNMRVSHDNDEAKQHVGLVSVPPATSSEPARQLIATSRSVLNLNHTR
jgi:hypothetical protein